MPGGPPHIGTLRERPLHASLKQWYAHPGDLVEQPVDRFVIDLIRNDLLIEIQTTSFSSMKRKVVALLDSGRRLRIVHPIAVNRWIVKLDDNGETAGRRMSPLHGHPSDVFGELVAFPDLMTHPGLELEILLTSEEELRRYEPGRAWRRQGWVVAERRLVEVNASLLLETAADLAGLLPDGLGAPFTTAELAEALGRPRRNAQQMAYCLRHAGVIEVVGKAGNSVEYVRLKGPPSGPSREGFQS